MANPLTLHCLACPFARQPAASAPHRRAVCRSSKNKGSAERGDTLRSLDALLPSAPDPAADAPPPPTPASLPPGEGYAWYDRPATPQKGPLRKKGMEAGAGGRYLDSEKFTRDMLELNVGRRMASGEGGPLPLPEAAPRASRVLAAATLLVGAGSFAGLLPPLPMDSIEVVAGAHWQLVTASLQPLDLFNLAATVVALGTAGAYAERRLGSTLFAASFLLAGATSATLYYAAAIAIDEGTATAGAAAALLGPAAALAAFLAANWRVLAAPQRLHCAAASLGLAAVMLTELDLLDPGYAFAAVAGLLLGFGAGPKLQVQRELDIQDGSMTISGDEEELEVVVDRRTAPRQWLVILAYALALAAVAASLDYVIFSSLVDRLQEYVLENWDDPEVQLERLHFAPETLYTA